MAPPGIPGREGGAPFTCVYVEQRPKTRYDGTLLPGNLITAVVGDVLQGDDTYPHHNRFTHTLHTTRTLLTYRQEAAMDQ